MNAVTSGTAVYYDKTIPTVTTVHVYTAEIPMMTTPSNSDVIEILVSFSENVQVDTTGGTPTLALETGDTDYTTDYVSTLANALLFQYKVDEGILTSPLDYTGTNALALNGGTITDEAGTLPIWF